jgi:hypothetical protein
MSVVSAQKTIGILGGGISGKLNKILRNIFSKNK